jgi:hypothetical protein
MDDFAGGLGLSRRQWDLTRVGLHPTAADDQSDAPPGVVRRMVALFHAPYVE